MRGKRILSGIGIVAVGIVLCLLLFREKEINFHDKYMGKDLTQGIEGMEREDTYSKYVEKHADAMYPDTSAEIELAKYVSGTGVEMRHDIVDEKNVFCTEEKSGVTWELEVRESGFYNLYMEYLVPDSRGVAAERAVYINGELPFEDAANIRFTRIWTDGGEVRTDNQGNEIRPVQVEKFEWQSTYFKDAMGYIAEPYMFYLQEGKNTLTLVGVNEPLYIRSLRVMAVSENVSYETYLAAQTGGEAKGEGRLYQEILQGEKATARSESSLYARYDRSSATTKPYSVTNTILNYIGGDAWKAAGQWIEWEFTVPEDGYYTVMIKGRQNYDRGSVSSRTVWVDGEIPFREWEEIGFSYGNEWECKTLSDEEGVPYKIYLTEGEHTLRLEATLGEMGALLERLEDSSYRLNQIYRKVLVYTGATPDKYRDYHIEQVYPEVMEAMEQESMRLYQLVDDMVAYSGQKADKIATAQTLAQQLERFVEYPEKITMEFTTFKDNITALGTAILNMNESRLDIDYLAISGVDAPPVVEKESFWAKAWHEVSSFAASFFVNYDAVGDVYEDDAEAITVWVLSGRDQGTILKSMIDDTFTPNTGIKVNVEIVAADALLSAVVAGRGPQVVLTVAADQPVNYALRSSAEDLTQFADIEEVLAPFTESSYLQYRMGDGIYGLPETQSFNVMFYRSDILEELGLSVPQTWQELIEMLPTIQGKNMSVGIPSAAGSNSGAVANTAIASSAPDLTLYLSMLYQYGGDLYNEAETRTIVNEEAGVEAFNDYTRYFTDYGIPTVYDFVSRFRSGEMPIGLASYATYNTLTVSAPEIRGLWDIALIPGTEKEAEDGTAYIDRSDVISGTATMMIKQEDEQMRQRAWEFMKWWASTDIQIRFGREIEALLGSSARYATANKEAFAGLAWSADEIEVLSAQWDWTKGIREIPGGYYTGRHITNAIRKVINDKDDPRETIIDYAITIDEEIEKKRIEFGLPME